MHCMRPFVQKRTLLRCVFWHRSKICGQPILMIWFKDLETAWHHPHWKRVPRILSVICLYLRRRLRYYFKFRLTTSTSQTQIKLKGKRGKKRLRRFAWVKCKEHVFECMQSTSPPPTFAMSCGYWSTLLILEVMFKSYMLNVEMIS